MAHVLRSATIVAFTLGILLSLGFSAAACATHASDADTCGAIASVPRGASGGLCTAGTTCIGAMAGQHLAAWWDQWQTFLPTALAAALLATVLIVVAHAAIPALAQWLRVRPQLQPTVDPSPNMRFWDPLRFAFARGTVQHGSRGQ